LQFVIVFLNCFVAILLAMMEGNNFAMDTCFSQVHIRRNGLPRLHENDGKTQNDALLCYCEERRDEVIHSLL
jgi:hypothetical protein